MSKCLYFVCPTDHLEPIINRVFKYKNYYYTSLGNSARFDSQTVQQIKKLTNTKKIEQMKFVLSYNNRFFLDALRNHNFINVRGLDNFYDEITKQKIRSEILGRTDYSKFLVLSYFLNRKIKELQLELANLGNDSIKISGKIYNREKNTFTDTNSNLICMEKHYFN